MLVLKENHFLHLWIMIMSKKGFFQSRDGNYSMNRLLSFILVLSGISFIAWGLILLTLALFFIKNDCENVVSLLISGAIPVIIGSMEMLGGNWFKILHKKTELQDKNLTDQERE